MKINGVFGGIDPHNLHVRNKRMTTSCSGRFTPKGKYPRYPFSEGGLNPEAMQTFSKRVKRLAHSENRTESLSIHSVAWSLY